MLDAVPLCATLWDANLNRIDCNQEAVSLFGLSSRQEYLDRFFELSPANQPDGSPSRESAAAYIRQAFDTGRVRFEWIHQKLDGTPIPAEITLVRVEYDNGYLVTGYTRDLRELKAMEAETKKASERMRIMLDSVPLSFTLWDAGFNRIDCNQEAVSLFELSSKQEYIDRFFELSPEYQPDGRPSREKAIEMLSRTVETGRERFEWMRQKLNGDAIPSEITLVRVDKEDGYVIAGYTRDLREIKHTVSRLNRMEQLAFTDAVTGISNRYHFMENAKKVLLSLSATRTISIMMIDLDHFKSVNDTYGHVIGDSILKAVAKKIQYTLRDTDNVARYGGEEFIVIVEHDSRDTIIRLAERIRQEIHEAIFQCQEEDISVTISIGVAIQRNPSQTLEGLIARADYALYQAKANGRNRIEFAKDHDFSGPI